MPFLLLSGQSCLSEGIVFKSQSQLDSFTILFSDCKRILGDVVIQEEVDGDILDLSGLSNLVRVEGFFEIRQNTRLKDLRGLHNLQYIGERMGVAGNPSLQDLGGLQELTYVGNSVFIGNNLKLESIRDLAGLQVIRGDLSIVDTEVLSMLEGVQNIIEIEGNLIISNNSGLFTVEALRSVRKIDGDVLIDSNQKLEELRGLSRLRLISGDLIVDNNTSLKSLQGLNSLQVIDGFLQITNNPVLMNLLDLASLSKINGLLQIYNNQALENLVGLDQIDPMTIGNLAILDCGKLKSCNIESICQFLQMDTAQFSIRQNSIGCNDERQILDQCSDKGPTVTPGTSELIFFPNPTLGSTWLRGAVTDGIILVTDMLGRVFLEQDVDSHHFDFSFLPAGAYQVHVEGSRKTFTGILLKQ